MGFWKSLSGEVEDPNYVYRKDVDGLSIESFFQWFFTTDRYLKDNPVAKDETNYKSLVALFKKHEKVERLAIAGWLIKNIKIEPAGFGDNAYGEAFYAIEDNDEQMIRYFEIIKESLSHLPPLYYRAAVKHLSNPKEHEKEIVTFAKKILKQAQSK